MTIKAHTIRKNRRQQIEEFFSLNLGRTCPSAEMHAKFGSAFRTRVSEINRDPKSKIEIVNETSRQDRSIYWARIKNPLKPKQFSLIDANALDPD